MVEIETTPAPNLWPSRMAYMLLNAGYALFFIFINIYYRDIGLSGTQIGVLGMLIPLAGIFSATIWGYLHDRSRNPRLMFALLMPGTMLCVAGLWMARSFPLLLAITVFFGLFYNPIVPLIDSITLHLLGSRKEDYGKVRMWGVAAYVVFSGAGGYLLTRMGYDVLFIGFILTMAGLLGVALFLPNRPAPKEEGAVKGGVGQLLRSPLFLLLLGGAFLVMAAETSVMNFVGVRMKEMGGSESLIGLAWSIPAIPEIFWMYLGARLIGRIKSVNFLLISLFGFSLYLFFTAVMPRPEWFLWINLLTKPFAYVPFVLGSVAYAEELAPVQLKTTAQGLLNSTLSIAGLGSALLSGWLFDRIGAPKMFLVFAGLCLLGGVLFGLGKMVLSPKRAASSSPSEQTG